MKKQCIKCGCEEPFDYFADVEGQAFICNYCIRKEEEQVQSEIRLKYHEDKLYKNRFDHKYEKNYIQGNSKSVFKAVSRIIRGIVCLLFLLLILIGSIINIKQDYESKLESEKTKVDDFDIPNIESMFLVDTGDLDFESFCSESEADYDRDSYRDTVISSDSTGFKTYIANDQSAIFTIDTASGTLRFLEVNKINDEWNYGKASLDGDFKDLKRVLLKEGATYDDIRGIFELKKNGLHYKIEISIDVDGHISEFILNCVG